MNSDTDEAQLYNRTEDAGEKHDISRNRSEVQHALAGYVDRHRMSACEEKTIGEVAEEAVRQSRL